MKKKFNRQNPLVRRHGPKKRKYIIQEHLEELLKTEFFNEWRTSKEIAPKLSGDISSFWTPVSARVAGAFMRRYEEEYGLQKQTVGGKTKWKFAEPSGVMTED